MSKLLTSGILLVTTVNPELVAKPEMLDILLSILVMLAFKSVFFFARSLVSGIFLSASLILFSKFDLSVSFVVFKTNPVVSMLSTFVTNLSYKVFLTTSFFTGLLSLAKSSRTGANLSTSSLSTLVF